MSPPLPTLCPPGPFRLQPRGTGDVTAPAQEGLFVWVLIPRLSSYGEKSIKSWCLTKALDLLLNLVLRITEILGCNQGFEHVV